PVAQLEAPQGRRREQGGGGGGGGSHGPLTISGLPARPNTRPLCWAVVLVGAHTAQSPLAHRYSSILAWWQRVRPTAAPRESAPRRPRRPRCSSTSTSRRTSSSRSSTVRSTSP